MAVEARSEHQEPPNVEDRIRSFYDLIELIREGVQCYLEEGATVVNAEHAMADSTFARLYVERKADQEVWDAVCSAAKTDDSIQWIALY